MESTAQFLVDRYNLAKGEHKLRLERLANIVIVTCSCGKFHTLRLIKDEMEGGVEHYRHCEFMALEAILTARCLAAIQDSVHSI